jgi:hypothetical protein
MSLRTALIVIVLAASATATDCWAWGATGHEWISGIAIEKLPDSVPAFARTPEVAAEIAVMGRELDRSRGAGKIHDAERDPGHYVDLADNGEVMGVIPLAKLPPTREAYDTELRAKGFTQYKAGYLPYSIADGWQQIRKDFAYWRALTKGIETAATPEERAWFEADRRHRPKWGASLRKADVREALLSQAILRGADLRLADLEGDRAASERAPIALASERPCGAFLAQ